MSDSLILSNIAVGQRVRLVRADTGRRFSHRLAELGLTPGVEFSVLHDSGGPLLLSVRNSRVAIGRGMANKISVDLIG
jgi:Fe2+ transport system protein FeoA